MLINGWSPGTIHWGLIVRKITGVMDLLIKEIVGNKRRDGKSAG